MPSAACASAESVPGTVTYAAGDWTVPRATSGFGSSCFDRGNTWFDASEWVGIDGFSSPTVEQIGTAVDCYYGQAQYYAWYELFPSQPSELTIPVTVSPGDLIKASVTCTGTAPASVTCSASLTDVANGQSFTSPATAVPGAYLQSAEWIEENSYYAPGISYLALTQTSPILFTGAMATIGGVTKSLSSWGTSVFWFPSTTYDFGSPPEGTTLSSVKAIPSVAFGGSFLIRWLSSGP